MWILLKFIFASRMMASGWAYTMYGGWRAIEGTSNSGARYSTGNDRSLGVGYFQESNEVGNANSGVGGYFGEGRYSTRGNDYSGGDHFGEIIYGSRHSETGYPFKSSRGEFSGRSSSGISMRTYFGNHSESEPATANSYGGFTGAVHFGGIQPETEGFTTGYSKSTYSGDHSGRSSFATNFDEGGVSSGRTSSVAHLGSANLGEVEHSSSGLIPGTNFGDNFEGGSSADLWTSDYSGRHFGSSYSAKESRNITQIHGNYSEMSHAKVGGSPSGHNASSSIKSGYSGNINTNGCFGGKSNQNGSSEEKTTQAENQTHLEPSRVRSTGVIELGGSGHDSTPLRISFHNEPASIEIVEQTASSQASGGSSGEIAMFNREAPIRFVHTRERPVIQEVREIIMPYRNVLQEVRPMREQIRTIVRQPVLPSGGGTHQLGGALKSEPFTTGPNVWRGLVRNVALATATTNRGGSGAVSSNRFGFATRCSTL